MSSSKRRAAVKKRRALSLRVDAPVYDELARLAQADERRLSAFAEVVLKRYVFPPDSRREKGNGGAPAAARGR